MKPAILIARALLPAGLDLIAEVAEVRVGGLDATREELLELAPGAAAIVADPTVPVDGELLDAAGETLRVVANFAVGYDNVDLDACRERGIAVTNTPGVLTDATAELALAVTLAAARGTGELERKLREGRWTGWDPGADLGTELSGATFAVVGLGRIGLRYAELVRPLAGRLLYVARSPKPDAEEELKVERAELPEALAAADVVSLHAPGGEATRHLIGAAELAAMKSTRDPRQHVARHPRRLGRARGGSRGGRDRRRRPRRLRGRAAGRRGAARGAERDPASTRRLGHPPRP